MSYLTLQSGVADFSKAVFSLWFRAPSASVIKAANQLLPTDVENFYMMQRILPLVTFGAKQENKNYQSEYKDVVHGSPPENPIHSVQPQPPEPKTPYEVDPSYIGLQCYEDGTFDLAFNIQTDVYGEYQYLVWYMTSLDYNPGGTGKYQAGDYTATMVDGSYAIQDAQAEWFHVVSDQTFEPDKWHHVLLSFDIERTSEIGLKPIGECQLWYAIDDVDYRGPENLGPYRDEDDGLGDNIIVTHNIYRYSGPGTPGDVFPPGEGHVPPGQVPSTGAELALPAASRHVGAICRVEMAEFQMFTGVTLDTGDVSNRRAFVDGDGKPVNPNEGKTDKDLRGPAERLLGKPPDILLHGSANWQKGRNTGSIGIKIENDGTTTELPEGQFERVAGIEKYKPEPALGA